MKYQDSIKQADELLSLAVNQLRLWHLAASPINYAVSYEFVSQSKVENARYFSIHFLFERTVCSVR